MSSEVIKDPMLWITISLTLIVYILEMFVAYLWAIKSFDLKWWLYEILWFGLLGCYCSSTYIAYNNIKDINLKSRLIVIFIVGLFVNLLWTLYYAGTGGLNDSREGRFLIAMINVLIVSYQYTIMGSATDGNLSLPRWLLLPYIIFIFIGGVAFGVEDIGSDNVRIVEALRLR